jgi:hypothetical protein
MRQVFRSSSPEPFGEGIVGPCVSLGALVDAEMLAKLDVFGSSQLELAVWVADPVLSVLVLVCC